ncbi:MAG TPA: glycosyltransferase family 4 protein [Dermatophilaceae bacterium]|nr:glycosyltransferase family 4 protein [Dermatophilaceae bacterium]
MRLRFVVPDLARPTGGNRYDQALSQALLSAGVDVDLIPVEGRWPVGDPGARDRLAAALCAELVLVDGLLACGAPDAVRQATAAGARVHVLVHLPLALESGLDARTAASRDALERQALAAATGTVATSRWCAEQVRSRHGRAAVAVAQPGADPAAVAAGSDPPKLLHLAALTPLKDQLSVVAGLRLLTDLRWTAELTGPRDVDPGYAEKVRAAAGELGTRVRLTGAKTGPELEAAFAGTDLLLLPSRAETWGLVVTEALARGIPALVSEGTGAVEALGLAPSGRPGATVPSGDPPALAAAIARLLGPDRDRARRAALERRSALRTWADTAQDVLAAVGNKG